MSTMLTTQEREWALFAARMFTLENPSFMVVLRHYHVLSHEFFCPPEKVELEVSDGRRWSIYSLCRRAKGAILSRGWATFVNENHLAIGDISVFELIHIKDVVLRVSIFWTNEDARLLKVTIKRFVSKMAVPSTIPVFFKIFNPDMSSHRLQIPSCFTSYMKGKLPNSTTSLRDRCGNVWHVEVAREGNNLYFENGWLNFVEDNGFERGDILVFQFNGDCFFNFKHYNKTAYENGVIGFFNFTAKEEEEQVCKVEDDREEDEEEEDVKVKKIKMTVPKKEFESSSTRVKKDKVPKKEFESSSASVEKDATARSKEKAVVKDEGGLENNVNEVDRRRGVDIFKSGQIAPPKNPYFISLVKRMKRNELSIPVEVIRDQNLEITGEIIIRGEDGKEFHSRINTWGDGRKRVTDGWRAFCRWNFAKEEDTCLCEFRTSHKLLIRVLDFQAGKWMSRPRS